MMIGILRISCLAAVLFTGATTAMHCTIGQEPDPASHHRLRWVIPVEDPCQCTRVEVGGWNSLVPYRPFKVSYYDTFIHGDHRAQIREWLNCSDAFVCVNDKPLGMEDGTIPDDSITSSSNYLIEYFPARARLNTEGFPGAWCPIIEPSQWIQVEFKVNVRVTALITQGRRDIEFWVKAYQVAQSDDGLAWEHVTDENGNQATFQGNYDRNTLVITKFSSALQTRFLRILPIYCNTYCCMRFEVVGCYELE